MKIYKPKFWDKKLSFFSIIFFPLSIVFIIFVFLKKKLTKPISFKIPIICVGNIYIGGTGKTPTSILLANEFSKIGKKTTIIRKYYKNHEDEYGMIRDKFKELMINKNRIDSLYEAEKNNFNMAILDDGLQDYKIKKKANIVCFNSDQLIGNGFVLPSGPLRENLSSLKNSDIIIINGSTNKEFEEHILEINSKLKIFYSNYRPINIQQFKNKKLLALAGIGNPDNFFKLLEENDLKIEKKIIFPDHYKFSKNEIKNILFEAKKFNLEVIMTEKDFFKINKFNLGTIGYLKVNLEIKEIKKLISEIRKLYD